MLPKYSGAFALLATLILFTAHREASAQIGSGVTQLSGVNINEKQLGAFLQDVKTLEVGSDGPDQIVQTIGAPHVRDKEAGRERWKYSFILGLEPDPSSGMMEFGKAYQVDAVLEIAVTGALENVKVERLRRGETEVLYRRGNENVSSGGAAATVVAASLPAAAAPGTIYLNSSDGHFYGWNGTEWRRLDD
jgi:hypothetical protein